MYYHYTFRYVFPGDKWNVSRNCRATWTSRSAVDPHGYRRLASLVFTASAITISSEGGETGNYEISTRQPSIREETILFNKNLSPVSCISHWKMTEDYCFCKTVVNIQQHKEINKECPCQYGWNNIHRHWISCKWTGVRIIFFPLFTPFQS